MKTILITYLFLFCFLLTGKAQTQQEVSYFPLQDVKLLESPFLQAQQTDLHYIMAMEPDRLLAPFLREAGLTPKAPSYTNWENTGLDGHIGGHYISALSMMYAATGDTAIYNRLNYMLNELHRAQQAVGTGFIGGTPGSLQLWKEIKAGNIRAGGFDLNGKWVPLYNIHKTYAGLRDAYLYAGSDLARQMLVALTDWMIDITAGLTDQQMQDMLRSEHGGLNETFADVAEITGDKKYLELARRFSHKVILDPLVKDEDCLTGMHANTQIPKVIGYKRIADLAQDQNWDHAARFFWNTVVNHRSVCIGGNSVREHFHPADNFTSMLNDVQGPETCNTYNMLRLTKMLYQTSPDIRFADYYERALYNHILGQQDPETGMVCYFLPLLNGAHKVYSTKENSFWCCVGSGFESHAKYGEAIYYHNDGAIYVNLFIPSVVSWKEKGMTLRQETAFPSEETTVLTVGAEQPVRTTVCLRYPSWSGKASVFVNGKKVSVKQKPGSYIALTRLWKSGDRIEVTYPMQVSLETTPDNPRKAALLYGPIVLAGERGTEGMQAPAPFSNPALYNDYYTYDYHVPADLKTALEIDVKHPGRALRRVGKELKFATTQGDVLRPLYDMHRQRYVVYWDLMK